MSGIPPTLQTLADQLAKLPGIGKKSAQRMAIHILKQSTDQANLLAQAILDVKAKLQLCSSCFNISEGERCAICSDTRRDQQMICVVEQATDILPLEKSQAFSGLYHVLGGVLAPLDRQNESDLHIEELVHRIRRDQVREVIIATNPTSEGETTALLVAQRLKPTGVKVTRIARGVPVGSELEFADEATLTRALQGRGEL
ncbi:MAG: recombination mediator RecR [bacterium]|nr:recombination mediator RecR [bacterium]